MSRRFLRQVSQHTPESVELEFVLAGIGNRTLAYLIDYLILILVLVGFWILWLIFSIGLTSTLQNLNINYRNAPIWLLAIALLLSFIIYSGYFTFFETTWRGQTPGKRWVKIRVVRDDGRPIGLAQATLRAVLRPVDDFMFMGMFLILLGKQEKRIGDIVAGTIVIQEEGGNQRERLSISPTAQEFASKLPELANISQMTADDFAVIAAYLKRRSLMTLQARSDLSLKLARQLRSIVELTTIPEGTTSDHFLEAIYLAYQKQVGEPTSDHLR